MDRMDSDVIPLAENEVTDPSQDDDHAVAETSFKKKIIKPKGKPMTSYPGTLVQGLLRRKRQRDSRPSWFSKHSRPSTSTSTSSCSAFDRLQSPEEDTTNAQGNTYDSNYLLFAMRRSGSYGEALDEVGVNDLSSTGDRTSANGSVYTINVDSRPSSRNTTIPTPGGSVVQSTANLVSDSAPDLDYAERESWDNKTQYLLAAIGLAVGLGNVWRFPYLAQKNGGGAFLFPYVIMLFVEGLPLFYMEVAIGQRMRKGPIGTWNQISPYIGGIGFSCVMVSFIVSIYYNTVISWCLYYLVLSFRSTLLWSGCPNGSTQALRECEIAGPTAYFWYRTTLDISTSIEEPGILQYHLELCLFFAWVIVFLCMIQGIGSSGKVVYFTATFPYLVLIIFFFRGVTLENFHVGLKHMFIPKFERLADPQVWLEAATQIFYSLSLGFGGLMAMSSYNPIRNNCYKDTLIVVFVNCGTSVFAGIVIFSIMGFKATQRFKHCEADWAKLGNVSMLTSTLSNLKPCDLNRELEDSAEGPGLAFIVFTEAINQFPVPPIWAILFFLMLLTLGLDSMFGTVECVTTCIMDSGKFPDLKKKKFVLPAVVCILSFLVSFSFANQSGSYTFILFDEFTGGLPLLVIALAEVLSISYIYGLNRFANDIELMVGTRPGYYFLFMWKFISPFVMIIILLASVLKNMITGMSYKVWDKDTARSIETQWPGWCLFLGALLIIIIIIWIPLVFIVKRFNLTGWKRDTPVPFPEEQLRKERNIQPYILKDWERKYLFIFEGLPRT